MRRFVIIGAALLALGIVSLVIIVSLAGSPTPPTISIQDQDSQGEVKVSFTLPEDAKGFIVLKTEDGTQIGYTDFLDYSVPDYHADGYPILVRANLHGSYNVSATFYRDSNNNGEFDPEVDQPWKQNGQTVMDNAPVFFSSEDSIYI